MKDEFLFQNNKREIKIISFDYGFLTEFKQNKMYQKTILREFILRKSWFKTTKSILKQEFIKAKIIILKNLFLQLNQNIIETKWFSNKNFRTCDIY